MRFTRVWILFWKKSIIVFIIPIIRDMRQILKDLLQIIIKQNEMITSMHDKIMEIRNYTEEFYISKKK